MNILLANDDGINAPGIQALLHAVPKGSKMVVAAPANEKSASSHSISLGQKLRVEEYTANGFPHYAVHGTPADCVKYAISEIKNFKPDIIISGINQGANTGVSVYYSGTISAAREGFINRFPSIAISLCSGSFRDFSAGVLLMKWILEIFQKQPFVPNVMLNINLPPLPAHQIKGIRVTKQANSRFIEEFVKEKEHEGKKVYSLAGEIQLYEPDGKSDEEAVAEGYISITPLKLDLTEYGLFSFFEGWFKNCNLKDIYPEFAQKPQKL